MNKKDTVIKLDENMEKKIDQNLDKINKSSIFDKKITLD